MKHVQVLKDTLLIKKVEKIDEGIYHVAWYLKMKGRFYVKC